VKGFAMVPTHVLRNRALSASARLLYGVILTYAWGENPCKASNETLCADCGIGRTALYDALNALKAGELIDVKVIGKLREITPTMTGGVRIPDADWDVSVRESGIRNQDTEVDEVEVREEDESKPSSLSATDGTHEQKRDEPATKDSVPPGSMVREHAISQRESQGHIERDLFDHWKQATGHTQAVFTPERRTKIRARLAEGYTPLDIRTAIDGAAKAPFVNDAGKRFDDLTLICRNGSKLEDFIDRAQVRQSSNVSRSTLGDLDKLRSYGSASAPRGSADDLRRRAGGH
jgi:hypothetical protein